MRRRCNRSNSVLAGVNIVRIPGIRIALTTSLVALARNPIVPRTVARLRFPSTLPTLSTPSIVARSVAATRPARLRKTPGRPPFSPVPLPSPLPLRQAESPAQCPTSPQLKHLVLAVTSWLLKLICPSKWTCHLSCTKPQLVVPSALQKEMTRLRKRCACTESRKTNTCRQL